MTQTSGWSTWLGTSEAWDTTQLSFEDANIYQCGGWGRHRSNFGWSVTQFAHTANGTATAMAQVLHRKVTPLATLCWIPGGPVGDLNKCDTELIACIRKLFATQIVYIHISPMRQYSSELASSLQSYGWRRPKGMLNSGKTLVYEIEADVAQRLAKLSKNWSRNLSRGQQRELTVSEWTNPNTTQIVTLMTEMSQYKKLGYSRQKLEQTTESLLAIYGTDVLMVKCTNPDGEILALRGAIKLGDKAFDMFAAATPAGRKEYASNLCFWKLIELCQRYGIGRYDLSGVDPDRNVGVYNFKKGIGANDFVYLGEWTYSRPDFVGIIVSRMITRRMRP